MQLDAVHLSGPVLGEEQFFDIELDRNTNFLPPSEEPIPGWNYAGDDAKAGTEGTVIQEGSEKEDVPGASVCSLQSFS